MSIDGELLAREIGRRISPSNIRASGPMTMQSVHNPFSRLLVVIVGCLAISARGGDTTAAPKMATSSGVNDVAAAYQLIDVALNSSRKLPAFRTMSVQEHGRGLVRTTRWVRNQGTSVQFFREERSYELPKIPPHKTIIIQNSEGLWQPQTGTTLRLMFPLRLERPIPRRLPTAQFLCAVNRLDYDENTHLVAAVEHGVDHFGTPATRVMVSVADELTLLLDKPVSLVSDPTQRGESGERSQAKEVPVTFVYIIADSTPFVLSWQAYGHSGAKLAEISFQEFEVVSELPDDLFTVPASEKMVTVENQTAYREIRRQIDSKSAKTNRD